MHFKRNASETMYLGNPRRYVEEIEQMSRNDLKSLAKVDGKNVKKTPININPLTVNLL